MQIKNKLSDQCPVCGMKVESAQYKTQYHKMYFHLCSEQCRETFATRPQRYANGAVEKRTAVIKHRNLRLAKAHSLDEVKVIEAYLLEMMGMTDAHIQGECLQISYDLLQVTQARIEQLLNKLEAGLDNSWWQRLRRGWIHNTEENELGNLRRGSGACCNRSPPGVR